MALHSSHTLLFSTGPDGTSCPLSRYLCSIADRRQLQEYLADLLMDAGSKTVDTFATELIDRRAAAAAAAMTAAAAASQDTTVGSWRLFSDLISCRLLCASSAHTRSSVPDHARVPRREKTVQARQKAARNPVQQVRQRQNPSPP